MRNVYIKRIGLLLCAFLCGCFTLWAQPVTVSSPDGKIKGTF